MAEQPSGSAISLITPANIVKEGWLFKRGNRI